MKPLWNYSNQHKFFSSHTPWLLNLTSELFIIKFSMVSSIPIQVVPNRLHFKRSLFFLYLGIRVAVSSFFYFCPFSKTFWSDFESFWHLLTNEKNIIITARHYSRSSDYKMPFSSSTYLFASHW